jgi:cell division protein FtsB
MTAHALKSEPSEDVTALVARLRELEAENRRLRETVARLEGGQIDFTPGSPAWAAAVEAAGRRMGGGGRQDPDAVMFTL